MQFARAHYAPTTFILCVAAFNQRAITVYERAGFRKVRRRLRFTSHGPLLFWEMRRPA
jgi:ribosomal-protein-alanine N-acetyltransferase